MDKKNIPNTKDSHKKRLSGARLLDLATSAAILASLFSSTPDYAQTSSYPVDAQKKNTLELVENRGSMEHQKIIKENVKDILGIYGKEKWMEIIREHFLEEINIYRKLNNRPPLVLDTVLGAAAQRFAEYWSPKHQLWHEFDGKSVRDMWIDLSNYSGRWENVAYGEITIDDIVSDRYYKSEWHKKTLLGLHISKNSWEIIPYTSLGIGISWSFVVAEFATHE